MGVLMSSGLLVQPAGATTIDGLFDAIGPVTGGSLVNLTVAGRGGVPASGAGAVALNVTVTNPTVAGFVTVWPTGSPRPLASNLNFVPGQTVPNMVTVPLGNGGQVSVYASSGTVDVIVDVLGWFPTGSGFGGLTPARLMDTRAGASTVDGVAAAGGPLVGGAPVDVTMLGRGGVPMAGASAVALNVTVTNPTVAGFVTVWPTGSLRPLASNLNFVPLQTVPNMVVVPVGAGGQVSVFASSGTVDVIVDVLGFFATGTGFTGLTPARLMDTRRGSTTVDGALAGGGAIAGGSLANVATFGRGGTPIGAGAVALNVTVTNPTAAGFVTVWPAGSARPLASNLNFSPGQTVPNMVLVPVGVAGEVSVFVSAGSADVVVDVLGWFPSGVGFIGLTPARLMDTRLPTPPPPPPPPPPATVLTFNAGTHLVNSTMPPGRYIANGARSGCYWERLNGLGGTLDEINANDFRSYAGRVIVDVLATDVAFEFDAGCGQFKTYTAAEPATVGIPPGTHAVGVHISPGTYTTNARAGCYWERLTSFDGELDSIIANDFVPSPEVLVVAISQGDVGFTSDIDCGTWTRV